MGDAPEKIWVSFTYKNFRRHPDHKGTSCCIGDAQDGPTDADAEYTRTDLSKAAISRARAEGRAEALREALAAVPTSYAIYGADRTDRYAKGFCGGVEAFRKGIAALQEAPDDDEDDDTCTGCGDTGFNPFVEKFCSCAEGVALALAAGRKETPDAE